MYGQILVVKSNILCVLFVLFVSFLSRSAVYGGGAGFVGRFAHGLSQKAIFCVFFLFFLSDVCRAPRFTVAHWFCRQIRARPARRESSRKKQHVSCFVV